MEITWFIIVVTTLCISAVALIKPIFNLLILFPASTSLRKKVNLPPGPPTVPIIGNLLWLLTPLSKFPSLASSLRSQYGLIFAVRIGCLPAIFIASPTLAHKALVQNGTVFSDRFKTLSTGKIVGSSSNQHTISTAAYGPTWRLLRRNLTSGILLPSRTKSYSVARQWVLSILLDRLVVESQSAAVTNKGVRVVDHFQHALFRLFSFMCFGDKLDEDQIREVERHHRRYLQSFKQFNVLHFFPMLGKCYASSSFFFFFSSFFFFFCKCHR